MLSSRRPMGSGPPYRKGKTMLQLLRLSVAVGLTAFAVAAQDTVATAEEEETRTMSLDVNETDIRDVIRMISRGYDLNIMLDNDVSGKVTLHLSDVPIMEGLQMLAESHGLEVSREGSVYRIRQATDERRSFIRYSNGLLTADVLNMPVLEFVKGISSKTAVNIVPESHLEGTVSGKLYQVPLDDGLRALLEGSGFKVVKRKNIYHVSDASESAPSSAPRRRASPRGRRSPGSFFVEFQGGKITLDVAGGDLENVINEIAVQSDIEIVTYGTVRGEVNAKLNAMPLTEALALLLGGTKFTFIERENVILIGDRNTATPSGQALSKSELIHLAHIKADEVPKILPKNIPQTNVKVVKEQNALLVSGTSEDIVKTREFLNTIDIPTPQVQIDAVVVEYSRDVERDFGVEFGSSEEGKHRFAYPYLEWHRGWKSGESAIEDFAKGTIGVLNDDFWVWLRLMEKEGKAKVLAQPRITVLNGNKATMNVGQTEYFKIVTGTSENPTYRFQSISFGITLNITPWISQGGQITAEVSPEISNAMGRSEEGTPNVFKRSVTTTVRLENGQTLVLGGLLRAEDQHNHFKVPILGDIPILGYLFKTTIHRKVKTNLVIYITPKILDRGAYVNLQEELEAFERRGYGVGLFGGSRAMDELHFVDQDSLEAGRSPETGEEGFVPDTSEGGAVEDGVLIPETEEAAGRDDLR